MKKFLDFSNEAFKPKNIKERQIDNFIKKAKASVDDIQNVLTDLHIENMDEKDLEKLKKSVDSMSTETSAEVGLKAMLNHYITNYTKEFKDEGDILSLSAFKNAVEKAVGYKFRANKISYDDALENFPSLGMYMYEDEDFLKHYKFKPEECAFYVLVRDTENRSELFYVGAIVTPKDVHMNYASDKITDSTTKGVPYKSITSHIKQVWG